MQIVQLHLFTINDQNDYYNTLPSDIEKKNNLTSTYSKVSSVSKKDKTVTVTLGNNGKQEVEISTSVTINKEWNDEDNKYNIRPSEVVVKLFQNEKEYATYTLKASENWTKTIENLPKYNDSGEEYVYTIKEDVINLSNGDRYEPVVSGMTITNNLVRIPRNIIVRHIDKATNSVLDTEEYQGYVDTEQYTSSKNISGYICVSDPLQKMLNLL